MKAAHRLSNKRVAARAVRSPERSAAASCATGPPEGWSSTATDHDEHTPTVDTVLGRGRVRPGRAPQPGLLERQAESRLNVRSAPQPPVQSSTSRTNLLAGSAIEFVVIRAWRAHVDPSTSGAHGNLADALRGLGDMPAADDAYTTASPWAARFARPQRSQTAGAHLCWAELRRADHRFGHLCPNGRIDVASMSDTTTADSA